MVFQRKILFDAKILFVILLSIIQLQMYFSIRVEPFTTCGKAEVKVKTNRCKLNKKVISKFCKTKYEKDVAVCESNPLDNKRCKWVAKNEYRSCKSYKQKTYFNQCKYNAKLCQTVVGFPEKLTVKQLMHNVYGNIQLGTDAETLQLWRQEELNLQSNPTSLWGWNGLNPNYYYEELPAYTRSVDNVDNSQSACSNGASSSTYSYTCPHLAMFAPDMLYAAEYENLSTDFYFGVAGTYTESQCGNCYQVKPSKPELGNPLAQNQKQFILQAFNYGSDVQPGQFDVFMGGGGFGYYTVCNKDCEDNYCGGGACLSNTYAMFQGTFNDWTDSITVQAYNTTPCYGGGVKTNQSSYNYTGSEIEIKCGNLIPFDPTTTSFESLALKDQFIYQSCLKTNQNQYHQNWLDTSYKRVQCPASLYMISGIKPDDDASQPLPDVTTTTWDGTFNGDAAAGDFGITTMQDCCKASCSWSYKNPSPDNANYPALFSCDKNGFILGYNSDDYSSPSIYDDDLTYR